MTDERMAEPLDVVVRRLPRGAGVVFRHHRSSPAERRVALRTVMMLTAKRHVALVRAGGDPLGRPRVPTHGRLGSWTWPAHDRAEAIRAVRAGAHIVFVSPVFATRSHPGARPLGPLRAAAIVRGLPLTAIALGGMTARRFRRMERLGFHGWAAIDEWARPASNPAR